MKTLKLPVAIGFTIVVLTTNRKKQDGFVSQEKMDKEIESPKADGISDMCRII